MPYIDVKINHNQARIYNAYRLPTLILFDKNRQEVFRHQGFLDRETLVQAMDQLLAQENRDID